MERKVCPRENIVRNIFNEAPMKENRPLLTSPSLSRTFVLLNLTLMIVLMAHKESAGQLTKIIKLEKGTPIRVKIVDYVSSSKVKIGDYVRFQVIDNVVIPFPGDDPQIVIGKDTLAFGRVVEHKNRRLFFKPGKVGVTLEEIVAADGSLVKVSIARHQNTLAPPEIAMLDFMPGQHLSESKREMRHVMCQNRMAKDFVKPGGDVPCVEGRAYISNFTAYLPSALLAAVSTTILGVEKDKTARAYAGYSLASAIASQTGLATIFNGSYSEFAANEVFDAVTLEDSWIKVKSTKTAAIFINRSSQTPDGYFATDYFSDPVRYSDGSKLYIWKAIERYEDKKKGDIMKICDGQKIPEDFMIVDSAFASSVCPRDPSDTNSAPTYNVIIRVKEAKTSPEPLRIERIRDTPKGFLVTDYFSDLVSYPKSAGRLYNGKVVENYEVKKKGETMRLCSGEKVPEDFEVIDTPNHPSICHREPGDLTPGPTYSVIMRMREPKSP
jgi:hypothetical protein